MRVLDRHNALFNLSSLGIKDANKQHLLNAITKPHGIILVTGPTGSGKTTTLYAALAKMDALHRSIFTLEDPIEYRLPMIRQTQVNPEIGMTFAGGLRALLRQDPDIILVGEIRDEETAQLATRAALTGHLVLSTLHTNSAAGAIPRLINMGVEPYLIASSLEAVLAQRLVRRICIHCKEIDPQAHTFAERYHIELPQNTDFYRGKGCPRCFNTGFLGRVALTEIMVIDDALVECIRPGITEREVEFIAQQNGMETILQDGILKSQASVTSLEDILRILA